MLTPEEWTAIELSLRVASCATLFGLPPAVAVAFLLARRNFFGRALLDALVVLPLVLPPVVTGYLLLIAFGRRGPLGHVFESCCGLVVSFRWTGAALAAGIMSFALVVRALRLSIAAVAQRL